MTNMTTFAPLHPMRHGERFRAHGLHADALISPFLGVDHAWMSGPTFPPHPHAGFSAVSYLFTDSETWVNNRDSMGGRQQILPGGLHWTAAGRGVVHEETPGEAGKTVHMLQVFVNLPRERQGDAPTALSLAPQAVPEVRLPGATVRVPLGAFGAVASPLSPPTEVTLLDIRLEPGGALQVPVKAGHTAFVLPIAGQPTVDGLLLDGEGAPVPVMPARAEDWTLALHAPHGAAQVAMFAGQALDQPVHRQGPMAMASAEALAQAVAAYRRGDLGQV